MLRMIARNPAIFLFFSLILIIALTPVLHGQGIPRIVGYLLLCLTPLSGVYAVADERRERLIAIVLGVPTFATILHGAFTDTPYSPVHTIIVGSYYAVVTVLITRRLFRLKQVTLDTITTAVSGYLLIGLTFAIVCAAVATNDPGAYATANESAATGFETVLYYSFVTLTTLGYGDILPVSHLARTLTIFESVFGVMYMATVIARIISIHQQQSMAE